MNKKTLMALCTLIEMALIAGCTPLPKGNSGLNSGQNRQTVNQAQSQAPKPNDSKGDDTHITPEQEAMLKDYADYLSAEVLFIRNGAREKAEEFANKEIENTKPYNLFKILTLAYLQNGKKNYAAAYQLTSSVIKSPLMPAYQDYLAKQISPQAFLIHAVAAAGLEKTDEALQSVKKAEEFDEVGSNYALITYHKAKTLALLGYVKQASDYLQTRIAQVDKTKQMPDYWLRVLAYAAQLSHYRNDIEQAKNAYEMLLAYSEEASKQLNSQVGQPLASDFYAEPEAHYNLAGIYATQGNKQKASEHYSAVIKIWPNSTDAHLKRGSLYLEAKQYKDAINDFSAVLKSEPNDASVLYKRAYASCMSGNAADGKTDLQSLLQVDPQHQQAKKLLKHCGA